LEVGARRVGANGFPAVSLCTRALDYGETLRNLRLVRSSSLKSQTRTGAFGSLGFRVALGVDDSPRPQMLWAMLTR